VLTERVQIGVRLTAPSNAGADLLYLTGDRAHFEALQAHAAARGLRLKADGLYGSDGALMPATAEADIYSALGLQVIPPEIREGDDAIALASRGALPALVSSDDIRGDLHMHSVWSDGRDAIETMVEGCRALGYQYMAITDHSPHSAASRNLTIDGVKKQADEIGRVRERNPDITILHGCEVDILPDGRLDFPDKVLEALDIVLASLHERAGHNPDQLMKRYASAMSHPLVTHHPSDQPSGAGSRRLRSRLRPPSRSPPKPDGSRSTDAVAPGSTRRAAPGYLGATVAIDSTATAQFCPTPDGSGTPRAAGLGEPTDVLNTRSLTDARSTIEAKRGSRWCRTP
jgi:DNA polymerase (family 10)